MKNRSCIICNKELSNKSKPTVYTVSEYPREYLPEHLYICAKCAKKFAPDLKTLLINYSNALKKE